LTVKYFFIENVGQGFARNYGIKEANGEYFVLFDSDCIVPPNYFGALNQAIIDRSLDAHGGPDAADDDFSHFQKAINYSMTSWLTTGGIRGKLHDPAKYQARGYNMGFSRKAFEATQGFIDPNRGEDIELSIRMKKMGFKLELVEEAFVFHKRKNDFITFFKQSYSFGQNRVNVSRFHPEAIKTVHALPAGFLVGWIGVLVYWMLDLNQHFWVVSILALWFTAILLDATIRNKSVIVGLLSMLTAFGQLSFYGAGLMVEGMRKYLRG
jgi:GT2 family glycosyltransferase